MKSVIVFKFIMMLFLISYQSKVAEGSSSRVTRKGCYTFHDVDGSWDEANDACRGMMAHLVTMETTAEWNKVKGYLAEKVKERGSYTHYFIGLRKEGGMWKWMGAGAPGATVATADSRWQKSEPSTAFTENCAEINSFYRDQRGHFNNVKCNQNYRKVWTAARRGYICEDF